MRTTLLVLMAALILSAAVPASAQDEGDPPQDETVLPGLGIRLLEVPQDLAADPRANIYVTDHVVPGTTIERRVAVSNGTEQAMPVTLYGVAATVEDGWSVQDGEGGNELAEWITVEPDSLVLAPGERTEVLARIVVPGDAGGGERYAAIVVASEGGGDGDVQVISRVGIRVYLSVGGPVAPVQDFSIGELTGGRTAAGQPFIRVSVSNTGERAIDVSGEMGLTEGPAGLTAGPFPVALPKTIGPGDTGELKVPMDQSLPNGPWRVAVMLQSGLVEREAEGTITFPDAGELGVAVATIPIEEGRRTLPPLTIGGLIIGGLGLIGVPLLLAWRRRRRHVSTDDLIEAEVSEAAAPPPAGPPVLIAVPTATSPPTHAPVDGGHVPVAPARRATTAPVAPPPPPA